MGWSFRESIKILPGVRLSFSRRGVSASIGVKGLHLGVGGGRAPRLTGGIGPLHYYQSLGSKQGQRHAVPTGPRRSRYGLLIFAVLLTGILAAGFVVLRSRKPPGQNPAASMHAMSTGAGAATLPPTTTLPNTSSRQPSPAPMSRHAPKAGSAERKDSSR